MGVSSTECAIRGSSAASSSAAQAKFQQHSCHCSSAGSQQQQQQQQGVMIPAHHHHHHHHHHAPGHSHQQQQLHHHHHHHHQQQQLLQQQQQLQQQHVQVNETNNKIFAPIKSKMKVLKKIKKKIGLAPRSSNSGTNNLPPLTFHQVHGDNIRLCNGNTIARRHESFCKGVTFSARPVRVGEKVCVKFLEISDNWSGVIRFGFTSNDPINLRSGLPRYACPDLTNKPGYWAKALAERFAERDTVLFYYVTSAGDVHFGVNGEEKGVFFGGVETRGPLWTVIDVYGNSTAIEFLDPNRQHFNNVRRSAECHSNYDNVNQQQQQQQQPISRHSSSSSAAMDDVSNQGREHAADSTSRIILPAMQQLSIQQQQQQHHEPDLELPGLRFQPQGVLFAPLPFHPTRGRNIRFSNQQCVATRTDTEFCHGYAFTGRPLLLGERLVVQVLSVEPMYVGALALGLTSCDPATLTSADLPEDSDQLLDRPEYWVVSKDVASSPQPGDEIAFTVTHSGQVQMSKNGGPTSVVMHVDQSLQLWAFVDVYGSTQRVRMLHSRAPPSVPSSPPRQQRMQPQNQTHCAPSPVAAAPAPVVTSVPGLANGEHSRFEMQVKPAVGGGTVLVVSLPPQNTYGMVGERAYAQRGPGRQPVPAVDNVPSSSSSSSTYTEPFEQAASPSSGASSSSSSSTHLAQWRETLQPMPAGQSSECSICYERNIDSVLYTCGHMCMCFTCAIQQWRGKGGGHCPLCRAQIRDVIRIFRS